jgi:hypothetical protein
METKRVILWLEEIAVSLADRFFHKLSAKVARVTDVFDAFTGMTGDGWANPWQVYRGSNATAERFDHQVLGPGDAGYSADHPMFGGNYLRFKSWTSGTTRQLSIGRRYTGDGGVDPTKDHTIQFTIRYEEDLTNSNFLTEANGSRYVIHDREMSLYNPSGTNELMFDSSKSTWGIQLYGYNTTYGNATWFIQSSSTTGVGSTSTGIVPVTGVNYTFTLDFHVSGASKTFDVRIQNDSWWDPLDWSGTGFGLYGSATGGTGPTGWLNFATRQSSNASSPRQFALDAVSITGTTLGPQPPGGMDRVVARFDGGNTTAVVDGYLGNKGDGWNSAWRADRWRTIDTKTVVMPGDSGFNELKSGSGPYLQMTSKGDNVDDHGRGWVDRDYKRDGRYPGIDWTSAHTIQFTIRIDEDIAGGGMFDASYDRYEIYDHDPTSTFNYADSTCAWYIQARGTGGSTYDAAQWAFNIGNRNGGGASFIDTNIDLVMGGVYDFTILVDPTTRSYNATVAQLGGDSFSASNIPWRTASTEVGGQLVFMAVMDKKNDIRAWSIDNIVIDQWTAPPIPSDIPGDANGDGRVDAGDAKIMADNWGKSGNAAWGDGDFNGDLKVDAKDAAILAANWGFVWTPAAAETSAAAVPEPGMAALLLTLLAAAATAFGRRR